MRRIFCSLLVATLPFGSVLAATSDFERRFRIVEADLPEQRGGAPNTFGAGLGR
jgi:hypothetical protein